MSTDRKRKWDQPASGDAGGELPSKVTKTEEASKATEAATAAVRQQTKYFLSPSSTYCFVLLYYRHLSLPKLLRSTVRPGSRVHPVEDSGLVLEGRRVRTISETHSMDRLRMTLRSTI
jgi:hypothetical protein